MAEQKFTVARVGAHMQDLYCPKCDRYVDSKSETYAGKRGHRHCAICGTRLTRTVVFTTEEGEPDSKEVPISTTQIEHRK